MDVLDDLESEAGEIWKSGNRFFNYSLSLHICRMAGCYSVVSDWMDEVQLQPHYADKLIREITGITNQSFGLPDFLASPFAYREAINQLNRKFPKVFSVLHGGFYPILNKNWLCYLMITEKFSQYFERYLAILGLGIIMIAIAFH